MKISAVGRAGFLEYIRRTQPRLYDAAMRRIKSENSGLGFALPDSTATSAAPVGSDTWADKLEKVLLAASQTYLTVEQMNAQKKLLNTQLSRAQAGLAPLDIDPAQYGITGGPQVSVGVSADTKKFLMYGGVALAVALIAPKILGR